MMLEAQEHIRVKLTVDTDTFSAGDRRYSFEMRETEVKRSGGHDTVGAKWTDDCCTWLVDVDDVDGGGSRRVTSARRSC